MHFRESANFEVKVRSIYHKEPALTNALLKYFPKMKVLHCWNHLKRDFKEELRKLNADSAEMAVYLADFRKLIQSESEDQFNRMYESLTQKWTASVKTYFDKNMKQDILKYSGRWIIEEFKGLYDSYSGITNNASESINAVLKRMTGWQELTV